jgi:hypothetical protein
LVRVIAGVPKEFPSPGQKWLPLKFIDGLYPDNFLEVPNKIQSHEEIIQVLRQVKPVAQLKRSSCIFLVPTFQMGAVSTRLLSPGQLAFVYRKHTLGALISERDYVNLSALVASMLIALKTLLQKPHTSGPKQVLGQSIRM